VQHGLWWCIHCLRELCSGQVCDSRRLHRLRRWNILVCTWIHRLYTLWCWELLHDDCGYELLLLSGLRERQIFDDFDNFGMFGLCSRQVFECVWPLCLLGLCRRHIFNKSGVDRCWRVFELHR
jgi:hypothetical protein